MLWRGMAWAALETKSAASSHAPLPVFHPNTNGEAVGNRLLAAPARRKTFHRYASGGKARQRKVFGPFNRFTSDEVTFCCNSLESPLIPISTVVIC